MFHKAYFYRVEVCSDASLTGFPDTGGKGRLLQCAGDSNEMDK